MKRVDKKLAENDVELFKNKTGQACILDWSESINNTS